MLQSNFTPENLSVSRADVQSLLDVKTPVSNLKTILLGRGLTQNEVDKIVSDLSSYA